MVDFFLSLDDASMSPVAEFALHGTTAAYDYRQFEHFQVEIDHDGFSTAASTPTATASSMSSK